MLSSPLAAVAASSPAVAAAGVAVQTEQHCFEADAVVVTVPLGVLKRPDTDGGIRFTPPLTQRKLDAISRLGFGSMNKVRGYLLLYCALLCKHGSCI